jgi:hypothetical protein
MRTAGKKTAKSFIKGVQGLGQALSSERYCSIWLRVRACMSDPDCQWSARSFVPLEELV